MVGGTYDYLQQMLLGVLSIYMSVGLVAAILNPAGTSNVRKHSMVSWKGSCCVDKCGGLFRVLGA